MHMVPLKLKRQNECPAIISRGLPGLSHPHPHPPKKEEIQIPPDFSI